MKEKKEMVRFIKSPENMILLDITGRARGRGAYICINEECFLNARKKKGLERSFKQQIPNTVYENLKEELNAAGNTQNL